MDIRTAAWKPTIFHRDALDSLYPNRSSPILLSLENIHRPERANLFPDGL